MNAAVAKRLSDPKPDEKHLANFEYEKHEKRVSVTLPNIGYFVLSEELSAILGYKSIAK